MSERNAEIVIRLQRERMDRAEQALVEIAGYARAALFCDEHGRLTALKAIIRLTEGKAP